jgi:YidC/Oxa1 family membrane protein insertase
LPEIRNPNLQSPGSGGGSGGDMRSTMIFALLMITVLLGYNYFFKPSQETTAPASETQSQAAQQTAGQTGQVGQAGQTGQPEQPGLTPASGQPPLAAGIAQAPAATPAVGAALETETTVENEQYKIVFTNRGAQVRQWILKKYTDSAGKPLDMVQPQVAEKFGFPLSFFTYEPALTGQLNQAHSPRPQAMPRPPKPMP